MTSDELASILSSTIEALQSDAGGLLFVKFPAAQGVDEPAQEEEYGELDLSTELESGGSTGRYGGGVQDAILMDNPGQ